MGCGASNPMDVAPIMGQMSGVKLAGNAAKELGVPEAGEHISTATDNEHAGRITEHAMAEAVDAAVDAVENGSENEEEEEEKQPRRRRR
mmetsp:Transcript_37008/g.109082  ORF Transcript_37008/g.109082 Transcript_37008/m.109082 type:complete len:89 (+) Transcript_37008:88-354(+)